MGYIRSNEDWYAANGDHRSPAQRAKDIGEQLRGDKHMPDSVRERLESEKRMNERDAEGRG